jgi:mannose-6-phosphate isomerase-like protein (cupin superfamily)
MASEAGEVTGIGVWSIFSFNTMTKLNLTILMLLAAAISAAAQSRQPAAPSQPVVVRSRQQLTDVIGSLEKQSGNTNQDIVAASGTQMRVAVFHDTKREGDPVEVHDGSDDIYYVLEGTATLLLGGSLVEPNEVSPGEWRAKTSAGGQKYEIRKGDLIVVPRGTPHQRTVTGKAFSMILIKVFESRQK